MAKKIFIFDYDGVIADSLDMCIEAFNTLKKKYGFPGELTKEAIEKPGGAADIVLRDGDRIIIPVFTNTVKINGEVMYSNTTPFVKGKNLKYYIEKAGGFSEKAKKNKAYVVYMNGSVSKAKKRSSKLVQPGCEIIVPARQQRDGLKTTEILSLGSTSASLATVVLALMNLLK